MFRSSATYYQTLQVSPTASTEVIEAVYRRLASMYHPDLNKDTDTTAEMQAINIAYSVLVDPEKRRAYDLKLTSGASISRFGWASMTWSARLAAVCILLSVVCLIGITQNLVQQNKVATSQASMESTVVAIQLERSTSSTTSFGAMNSAPQPSVSVPVEMRDDVAMLEPELPIIAQPGGKSDAAPSVKVDLDESEQRVVVAEEVATQIAEFFVNQTEAAHSASTPEANQAPPRNNNGLLEMDSTSVKLVDDAALVDSSEEASQSASDVQRSALGRKAKESTTHVVSPIHPYPNQIVGGMQTFEWDVGRELPEGNMIELIFWRPDQNPLLDGFGVAMPTVDTSITVNLDRLDETFGALLDPGSYQWGLIRVTMEPEYRRLELLSEAWPVRFENRGTVRNSTKRGGATQSGE